MSVSTWKDNRRRSSKRTRTLSYGVVTIPHTTAWISHFSNTPSCSAGLDFMATCVETPRCLRTEAPAGPLKTRELVLIVTVTQVIGNVALSRGMHHVGAALSLSPLTYLYALLNTWIAGGVLVLALWTFFNLALLTGRTLATFCR